jgi:hypothetical protein
MPTGEVTLAAAQVGGLERRASLSTVVSWSWKQLQPWEVQALVTISVFSGGLFQDAAEELLDFSEHWPQAPDALTIARRLEERSLLWVEAHASGSRLVLFESVHHSIEVQASELQEQRTRAWEALVTWCVSSGA